VFFFGSTFQFWAFAASIKLFRFISVTSSRTVGGLLGPVTNSSQGLCVSAPGDCEDREVGGMNGFGRGNRSTRRKPAATTLCPPDVTLASPARKLGPPRWEASDQPL
jgi:hypothetical protein